MPNEHESPPAACTLVTRSDLPSARVLAETYLDQHPGHEFVVAVLDGVAPAGAETRYRVVEAGWLGINESELLRMATCYPAPELAEALKPWLLTRLLADHPVAIYLSPQIQVCAPFGEVAELAHDHDIVLAPRLLRPLERDGKQPDEPTIMKAGAFDLGFVAVGWEAKPFLEFWADRSRWGTRGTTAEELADARWADQIPSLFRHRIIRDPGFGVGYWNLHERPLREHADGAVTVAGEPLRFFHFSGYRPETPWLLSTHCRERPRVLLSADTGLRRLCDSYRELLLAAGHRTPTGTSDYGFEELPDGTVLTLPMRGLFHAGWRASQRPAADQPHLARSRVDMPPHPFGADDGEAFKQWLTSTNSPVERAAGLNRLTMWLWASRIDLQIAFPEPCGTSAAVFRQWCRTHALAEELIPDWAAPAEPPVPADPVDTFGVNIAGYLTAEFGLGQMGRIMHHVAERTGIPVASVTEEHSITARTALDQPASAGRPVYPISILAVNGDYTELLLASHPEVGHHRYRIGLWAWELEDFPAAQRAGFAHVDEVWTVSEFARDAIAQHSPVPVKALPVPVLDPGAPTRRLRHPDHPVTFLYAFDFNSTGQRKNPWGLVDAFRLAFPDRRDVRLVLKATNSRLHQAAAERLRMTIGDDPRIEFIDRYLATDELNRLYADADAYVSLHRSEGFGLTVAEAMARGLPAIATDYSSTTEFLDDSVGWTIPYKLVDVGPGWLPYHPEGRWADPDLHAAARAMREVADNPDESARRGDAARERILRTRSVDAAADWMRAQLDRAYRTWQAREAETEPLAPAPTEPLDRAREALQWRPDTDAPTRTPLAPALRRAVLRALDHYDVHQRRVMGALVDGTRDSAQLLGQRIEETDRTQQARIESIEAEVSERIERLSAQLDRIERAIASVRRTV